MVQDYDIFNIGGHEYRDMKKAYHGTRVVWEPKKNLVPVTGTTIPSDGVYVLYNPYYQAAFSPDGVDTVAGLSGPTTYADSGQTSMLDWMMLFEFTSNGKMRVTGTNLLLTNAGSQSPDTVRGALLASTGVTVELTSYHVGNGNVYPMFTVNGQTFNLGFTVTGTAPNQTFFDPSWYNQNLGCYPDAYLCLYKVEDV